MNSTDTNTQTSPRESLGDLLRTFEMQWPTPRSVMEKIHKALQEAGKPGELRRIGQDERLAIQKTGGAIDLE